MNKNAIVINELIIKSLSLSDYQHVGNLPKVENLDIQYSQSAVFTPCDFAFPSNGIKSEATPDTEMILISDVDLSLLDELRAYGSVRNMKDRRTDFYDLRIKDQMPG
ncbi:hypothetical protein [Niastella populi]|uniref:Uncharacterized protein n=1 Tax=Niastella populi TaxID=550983 RepID=A0A1V9EVU7_9BACT|nr:hypothetical protein [Niastella populi]OQP50241.1 hypothetical protein A4R26_29895 [Niastella populi]